MCFDLCRCSMPFAAMRKAAMAAGAVAGGAAAAAQVAACLPLPVSTAQTHAGAAVLRGVCFYNFQASMSANRFVMCAIVNDGVLSEERPPLCSPVPSSLRPSPRVPRPGYHSVERQLSLYCQGVTGSSLGTSSFQSSGGKMVPGVWHGRQPIATHWGRGPPHGS